MNDVPLAREWSGADNLGAAGETLRIGTWNVLADACVDGAGFEPAPPALDWATRSARALAIIDAAGPFDVLALVECDHYDDFWAPAMLERGMRGTFARKLVHRSEHGVALFVRVTRLDVELALTMHDGVACVAAVVRDVRTRTRYLVAATHLRAKEPRADERSAQVAKIVRYVAPLSNSAIDATLLVGDWNAPLDEECMRQVQTWFNVAPLFRPAWTTWKRRAGVEVRRAIDHVLGTDDVAAARWLDVPRDDVVGADALPGARYTSDHLLLAADIRLVSVQCGNRSLD